MPAIDKKSISFALAFVLPLLAPFAPAMAQYAKSDPLIPPEFQIADERGVNLSSGTLQASVASLSIGPKDAELSYSLMPKGGYLFINNLNMVDNWSMFLVSKVTCSKSGTPDPNCISVDLSTSSSTFKANIFPQKRYYGGQYKPEDPDILTGASGQGIYISEDGTKYIFRDADSVPYGTQSNILHNAFYSTGNVSLLGEVQKTSGLVIKIYYKFYNGFARKQAVTASNGYMLKYNYTSSIESVSGGTNFSSISPSSIVALNAAVDYCDPMADVCTFTKNWPKLSYSVDMATRKISITDPTDLVRNVTTDANFLPTQIDTPYRSRIITYKYSTPFDLSSAYLSPINVVTSINDSGQMWLYNLVSVQGGQTILRTNTMTMTDALQNQYVMGSTFSTSGSLYNWRPPGKGIKSQSIGMDFANYRTGSATFESNSVEYTKNARGNDVKISAKPKSGSSEQIVDLLADYDATCTNRYKCNKPNWTRDGKGNQTDYIYNLDTGFPSSVTEPADANGVRPVKRYAYVSRYAWIKNASGGYSQAATPISMLTEERTCRTTATVGNACAGGSADEIVISYDYGPNSGPNNLLLRNKSVTAQDADGVIRSYRTCYGYDLNGNRISETSPRAGLCS